LRGALDPEDPLFGHDFHIWVDGALEALAAGLDHHRVVRVDLHLDVGRQRDRHASDSRHRSYPPDYLPDVADDFAADALLAGLGAARHTGRGRQDRNAEPAEDARDLRRAGVDAQAGLADALDAAQHRLVLANVPQLHLERPGRAFADRGVPLDVAFVLQDFG